MLRLEKMELVGFKSFSDRTEVSFPAGITAVVGPNGCGKSNIGDAINWVLGEQSPKMLRGTHMADVIFNGSEGRKSQGMAEVSLFLGGAEGIPYGEQGRIVVTRRLFRSGESLYLVNGARARLKDIQELLNQARVGARSYATIEQGKIDQILNAKPKDRRLIIEDAAGVAGYKHKRRLAELKLEATQANLLRVNDIVLEVERQIRSLKRQAAKARRYRKLRDELREKERIRFGIRAAEMDRELARLTETERQSSDAEAEVAARLGRKEVELVEQRGALEQANRAFREASERLHQIEIDVDRQETQIRSCGERIAESEESSEGQEAEAAELAERGATLVDESRAQQERIDLGRRELDDLARRQEAEQRGLDEAEGRLAGLRDDTEDLRRRQFESMNRAVEARNVLRHNEQELERNRVQRARLEAERATSSDDLSRLTNEAHALSAASRNQHRRLEELEGDLVRCEQTLQTARESQTTEVEALAAAREAEQSAVARLATLEDVSTRFAGVSDGVRTLLGAGENAGIRTRGVVADFIEAGPDVESAAEGYLDWFLPTVILEDDGDVQRATELLRSAGAGRTSLISRSQPAGCLAVGSSPNGRGELPAEILADRRVLGKLRDRLTLRSSANGAIDDRVGDAVLVDSLSSALDLHRRYPSADYLTPQGDVVYASGVISAGGRKQGDQGLLAHKRRMHEARAQAAEASERAGGLQDQVAQRRQQVVDLEVLVREQRQAREEATTQRIELEMRLRRSSEETERTGRQTSILADELATIVEQAERLGDALRGLVAGVEDAEAEHGEIERTLRARLEELEQQQLESKRLAERAGRLREEHAARRERQEAVEQEGRRLGQAAAEIEARVSSLKQAAEAARERARESAALRSETERQLMRHLEERRTLSEQAGRMEREIEERGRSLADRERGLQGVRQELEAARELTREAELARARAEADRTHLDDLCRQELGLAATEVTELAGEEMQDVDLDALSEEVERIKGQLESIGPVNMTAIDEFTELEERHEFLTSQRADLEQSMASLRETIRRINRSSRDRFLKAFEQIRLCYQEIFKLLFNGGRADLHLEEGEDVLDCGIEIMVQPPGKRLGSIQLMSGGEKALSAIALLFAVFRYQPSPFCLLDEVDAALDDANVGRFSRMVREYAGQTQFILITHNKLSMESADLLYGVTMEEPGVSKLVSLQLQ